jgi:hypothetical protein
MKKPDFSEIADYYSQITWREHFNWFFRPKFINYFSFNKC